MSWQEDTSATKADANAVVNGLGIGPANMIAKRLGEKGPIFTQLHRAATEGVRQLRSKVK